MRINIAKISRSDSAATAVKTKKANNHYKDTYMDDNKKITYADAGVDVNRGYQSVAKIKAHAFMAVFPVKHKNPS